MEPQKYQNKQISARHFCGKRAMEAKKNGNDAEFFLKVCVFLWPHLAFEDEMCPRWTNNSNYCHGRRSSSPGRALRLYLTCKLPDHLCVDGIDGKDIPDEEITPAVALGASVFEQWSTVSGIAVV